MNPVNQAIMAARLLLIAQAETTLCETKPGMGVFPRDEALSGSGRVAAISLHADVPRYEAAYTAPSRAAVETAGLIGLTAFVIDGLRDLDVGSWAGRSLDEIAASEPEAAAAFLADPSFAGHGGEAIAGLVARIETWLANVAEARRLTIAVASPAVIRAAFVAAVRGSASSFWHIDVAALTALTLTTNGRRWAVREVRPYRTGAQIRPSA